MDRVKGLVRLVFTLAAGWMVLDPALLQRVAPTDLIGPALGAVVVYVLGSVIADNIPA